MLRLLYVENCRLKMQLVTLFFVILLPSFAQEVPVDKNGYIVYCPCMGRFGNQVDQFLGALRFAKELDRTLVLPPWVEYRRGEAKSTQIPFKTYFKLKPLRRYHRIITMEKFMASIAPSVWPSGKRIAFCYRARSSTPDSTKQACDAKSGNPFGPFWDTFNVDFDDSALYGPLHFDLDTSGMAAKWKSTWSATEYPVLAFTGTPGNFPVQESNVRLHAYLEWSDLIMNRAKHFIHQVLPKGPFVGIHLRNGVDWTKACEHVGSSKTLFSSPQCTGYHGEKGTLTGEMCFPSRDVVLAQLSRVVKAINAKSVFVASDNDHMIDDINAALKEHNTTAYKYTNDDPHVDLAIMGRSNHFIGNCVSSFSAFVKRERDVLGLPSSFWAWPPILIAEKDEL